MLCIIRCLSMLDQKVFWMEKKHFHSQKQAEKPAVKEKGESRCIIDITHPWLPLINLHCLLQVPPLHLIYPQHLSDQLQFVPDSKASLQCLRQSTTLEQCFFFFFFFKSSATSAACFHTLSSTKNTFAWTQDLVQPQLIGEGKGEILIQK